MHAVVRIGNAGNGTPVFLVAGQSRELERVFGAVWDSQRFLWMYPAFFPAAKKVLADFEVLGRSSRIEFSDSAKQYIRQLDAVELRYKNMVLPKDFTFVTEPFAHQVEGLAHIYYFLRAALFYAPGLGKSKIATDLIRLLHLLGQKAPTVVMGPLMTVKNWGKELDRHSGGQLRWGAVLGDKNKKTKIIERAAAGEFDVLLVTYDTARNFVDLIFREVPYETIIADESHQIAHWTSARTKAVHEIGQKATRKVLMTGTPTLGNPLDLYGQFKFLGDCFMPESYVGYQNKFVEKLGPNSHVVLGYKNLDILNNRTLFLALRKSKEECLDLPEQTIVDIDYSLSRHQSVIYNQLVEEMKIDVELLLAQLGGTADDNLPPGAVLPHGAARLTKLLQICSGFLIKNNADLTICNTCAYMQACVDADIKPYTQDCRVAQKPPPNTITRFEKNPKLDALTELLTSILADPPNKVIVWGYYSEELNIIEAKLEALGVGYVRVDGSTGDKIQDRADRFNDDPSVRVYLAQISTGVGITLNSASYMIYYSLTYSLGAYLQSLDRNYRIGQTKNVTVYRLLAKHSVEGSIAKLLDHKVDADSTMTQKLSCIVCEHSFKCIAEGIKLFDPGCIYKRNVTRPVASARTIRLEEGE